MKLRVFAFLILTSARQGGDGVSLYATIFSEQNIQALIDRTVVPTLIFTRPSTVLSTADQKIFIAVNSSFWTDPAVFGLTVIEK